MSVRLQESGFVAAAERIRVSGQPTIPETARGMTDGGGPVKSRSVTVHGKVPV